MNEEEKKSIESLKHKIYDDINNDSWYWENDIKIVLNLIEKKLKEIEDLKLFQCNAKCMYRDKLEK